MGVIESCMAPLLLRSSLGSLCQLSCTSARDQAKRGRSPRERESYRDRPVNIQTVDEQKFSVIS